MWVGGWYECVYVGGVSVCLCVCAYVSIHVTNTPVIKGPGAWYKVTRNHSNHVYIM